MSDLCVVVKHQLGRSKISRINNLTTTTKIASSEHSKFEATKLYVM